MEKFYESEWHQIDFADVGKTSMSEMPGQEFYEAYYRAFFKRYKDWQELDPAWLKIKEQTARFIIKRYGENKSIKVLAIGCGLGIIEKLLLEAGLSGLEITEVSGSSLNWLRQYLPQQNIHLGYDLNDLLRDRNYDLVYLSNVEACLDQSEFIAMLKTIAGHLSPQGKCLVFSTALTAELRPGHYLSKKIEGLKASIGVLLRLVGLKRKRTYQFWGYLRTGAEFKAAFETAGYTKFKYGFLPKKTKWDLFWVEGEKGG